MTTPKAELRDTLVWSTKYLVWWKSGRAGYTNSVLHAGLYTEAEAAECCRARGVPGSEKAVKLADAIVDEGVKPGTVLAHFVDQLAISSAQAEWQPIETAPKDGTRILCSMSLTGKWEMIVLYYNILDEYWSDGYGKIVTESYLRYWTPLPAPPSAVRDVTK